MNKKEKLKIVLGGLSVLVGGILLHEYRRGRERHTFSRDLRRNTWF